MVTETAKHPMPAHLSAGARAWDQLGPKWRLAIIEQLRDGPKRFVQIQRDLSDGLDGRRISTEQLRAQLRKMTEAGLLRRDRYREVPPRVDYELTAKGEAALEVLAAFEAWAERYG